MNYFSGLLGYKVFLATKNTFDKPVVYLVAHLQAHLQSSSPLTSPLTI